MARHLFDVGTPSGNTLGKKLERRDGTEKIKELFRRMDRLTA
jgi:hypothetical protein